MDDFDYWYNEGWYDGDKEIGWFGLCDYNDFDYPEEFIAYQMGLEDRRESLR